MRRLARSRTLWMLVIVVGFSIVYAVIRERDPLTGNIGWWAVSVRTVVVAALGLALIYLYEVATATISRLRSERRAK